MVIGYIAFEVSRWPSALLIWHAFDREGHRVAQALAKHVPPGGAERRDDEHDDA